MSAAYRSIPAHAGKPPMPSNWPVQPRVYPRVCGETTTLEIRANIVQGLSPRVRGNRLVILDQAVVVRSIPACAGNPCCTRSDTPCTRVYPRVCGETGVSIDGQQYTPGLSPRVRGNRYAGRHGPGEVRSIPACAGKPPGRCTTTAGRPVYPRVCGETRETTRKC